MAVSLTVLTPSSAPTASVARNRRRAVTVLGIVIVLVPGMPFTIAKVYDSVASLMADYDSEDVKSGRFAGTDTDSVEDEDTLMLFLKGESA